MECYRKPTMNISTNASDDTESSPPALSVSSTTESDSVTTQEEDKLTNLLQTLSQDEFVNRCCKETSNLICNIYTVNALEIEDNNQGSLNFPLATDVFTVIDCQIALIRDYNHDSSMDFFGEISSFLFENLRSKQIEFRNQFLQDLESCCAASNTFLKMADRCEDMLNMLLEEFDDSLECKKGYDSQFKMAHTHCSELSLLYRADAIYAAQYTHVYVFKTIREIYVHKLFSKEWEVDYLENEISLSIVRTMAEYWTDVQKFIREEELVHKAAIAMIESCVAFYVEVMFSRAKEETHKRELKEKEEENLRCYTDYVDKPERWPYFNNPIEALQRLYLDIQLLKRNFQTLPVSMDIVEHRLAVLIVIYKCIKLWMESETPDDLKTLTHLFSVLDSFTGNPAISSKCMEDLLYLFAPIDAQTLATLKLRKAEKILFHPKSDRRQVPGLKVSTVLADMYQNIETHCESKKQLTRLKSIVKTVKSSKRIERLSNNEKMSMVIKNMQELVITNSNKLKNSTQVKKLKSSKTVKRCMSRSKSMVDYVNSKLDKHKAIEDESTFMSSINIDLCFLPDQEVYMESPVSDMFNQFLGALPPEEFLSRFHAQSTDLIERVYDNVHAVEVSNSGKLTMQLCSDVFSIVHSQLHLAYQYLKSTDSIVSIYRKEIVDKASWFLIESLRFHQMHCRDKLLFDFESCCAASNDFSIMATLCEEFITLLKSRDESSDATNDHASELILLYYEDAVYAAQCTHLHVFKPLRETVMDRLFLSDWEENFTHNELAQSIVTTISDFVHDLEQYVADEYLVGKAIHAILEATVLFYFESLVSRARKRRLFRTGCFALCSRALRRFQDDIAIFKDYFSTLNYSGLERSMDQKFANLKIFYDLLCVYGFAIIGTDCTEREIESFIPKIVELFEDVYLTKCCLSDLYNLFDPMQRGYIWKLFSNMERHLTCPKRHAYDFSYNRRNVPRLTFYAVLHDAYQSDLAERALTKYQKYKKRAFQMGLLHCTNHILRYRATRILLSSFEITAKSMITMVEKTAPLKLILPKSTGYVNISAFMDIFNSNGTMCATPIIKYLLGKVKYDGKIKG